MLYILNLHSAVYQLHFKKPGEHTVTVAKKCLNRTIHFFYHPSVFIQNGIFLNRMIALFKQVLLNDHNAGESPCERRIPRPFRSQRPHSKNIVRRQNKFISRGH